jgi:hypothetical protein
VAYADELLELALDIASLHAERPHQASLRRAVSTAYYAVSSIDLGGNVELEPA